MYTLINGFSFFRSILQTKPAVLNNPALLLVYGFVFLNLQYLYSQKKLDSLNEIIALNRKDTNHVKALNEKVKLLTSQKKFGDAEKNEAVAIAVCNDKIRSAPGPQKDAWKKWLAKSYYNLGALYRTEQNFDKAVEYYGKCLAVANEIKDRTISGSAYYGIGTMFLFQGKYYEALNNYNEAIKLRTESNDKKGLAACYNNIGVIYEKKGDYIEALKFHYRSLKMKELINDEKGLAASYNNIGVINVHQKNYDEALRCHNLALKFGEASGDLQSIANAYNNISIIYSEQKHYGQALKSYEKALAVREQTEDYSGTAEIYNNIAVINQVQNNDELALANHRKALEFRERVGDKAGIASSYNNIAKVYFKHKKIGEAKALALKALALSRATGVKVLTSEIYNTLSQADSLLGNWASAYNYFKLYVEYKDSVINEDNTKKTVQQQMQYEFDKLQAADSIQNAERIKQEEIKHQQEIQQQKFFTYGGILGFGLMIVIAAVSFRAYRQKRKDNDIIMHQKNIVEEKQKEILDSIYYARRIQKSLMPTDKFVARILDRVMKEKMR